MPDFTYDERDDVVFPELYHCRVCGIYVAPNYTPWVWNDDTNEAEQQVGDLRDELPICQQCKQRDVESCQ